MTSKEKKQMAAYVLNAMDAKQEAESQYYSVRYGLGSIVKNLLGSAVKSIFSGKKSN